MAAKKSTSEYSDLGSGTYEIPGVGLVLNSELLDGNDNDAIAAYHARDLEVEPPSSEPVGGEPVVPAGNDADNTAPTP